MIVCVILLQSLLAALGSIQFVSNIAFAYFVLNKTISVKYALFYFLEFFYKGNEFQTSNTWNYRFMKFLLCFSESW